MAGAVAPDRDARNRLALRCSDAMRAQAPVTLTLTGGETARGIITKMSRNGTPDPLRAHDPTTVTLDNRSIALGRITAIA